MVGATIFYFLVGVTSALGLAAWVNDERRMCRAREALRRRASFRVIE